MKPDSYMPLFIGDWLKDTGHLDATCQGAYFLLCIHHWGKPGIPCDNESLMSLMRVRPSDFARVTGILRSFFVESNGMWINQRCTKQYEKVCKQYERTVEASRLGVEKRKELGQIPKEPEDEPPVCPVDEPHKVRRSTQSKSKSNSSKEEIAEVSAVSEFRRLWDDEFQKHHNNQKYVHQGAKDAIAEKKILNAMSPQDAVSLAVKAWTNTGSFNCKFAVTIAGFGSKINEIRQETASKPTENKMTVFGITKIIEAKQRMADALKNKHCIEGPLSVDWNDKKAHADFIELRKQISSLNIQLAGMA